MSDHNTDYYSMNLQDKFTKLKTRDEGALIAYIYAGDPTPEATGILENYTNINSIIDSIVKRRDTDESKQSFGSL